MNSLRFPSEDKILTSLESHPLIREKKELFEKTPLILKAMAKCFANQQKTRADIREEIPWIMGTLYDEIKLCKGDTVLISVNLTQALADCAKGNAIVLSKKNSSNKRSGLHMRQHQISPIEKVQEVIVDDLPMTQINGVGDIISFTGRIVAYQTDSHYFGLDVGCFQDVDSSLKFAYIDPIYLKCGSEIGYQLIRFVAPTDFYGECIVVDSRLEEELLTMRLATQEEAQKIQEAILSKHAKLESLDERQALYFLDTHLSRL